MHIASARFRFTSFRWCRTRCAVIILKMSKAESRFCALARMPRPSYRRRQQQPGGPMELLQLEPPDYGVRTLGRYIIDDDGIAICAGPFDSETAAIGWIDQRHEMLSRHSQSDAPIH
jgi:hypothetical protein